MVMEKVEQKMPLQTSSSAVSVAVTDVNAFAARLARALLRTHQQQQQRKRNHRTATVQRNNSKRLRRASDLCLARFGAERRCLWARSLQYRLRFRRRRGRRQDSVLAALRRSHRRRVRRLDTATAEMVMEENELFDPKGMRKLRGLLPGGLKMCTEVLLREMADYVLGLQIQVDAMYKLLQMQSQQQHTHKIQQPSSYSSP